MAYGSDVTGLEALLHRSSSGSSDIAALPGSALLPIREDTTLQAGGNPPLMSDTDVLKGAANDLQSVSNSLIGDELTLLSKQVGRYAKRY